MCFIGMSWSLTRPWSSQTFRLCSIYCLSRKLSTLNFKFLKAFRSTSNSCPLQESSPLTCPHSHCWQCLYCQSSQGAWLLSSITHCWVSHIPEWRRSLFGISVYSRDGLSQSSAQSSRWHSQSPCSCTSSKAHPYCKDVPRLVKSHWLTRPLRSCWQIWMTRTRSSILSTQWRHWLPSWGGLCLINLRSWSHILTLYHHLISTGCENNHKLFASHSFHLHSSFPTEFWQAVFL